jgi:hypothetical protein
VAAPRPPRDPRDGPPRIGPPPLDGYVVEVVPGARARKDYACPGCSRDIPAGTGHVVAWPVDLVDDRRHWHRHCWRLAANRGRL